METQQTAIIFGSNGQDGYYLNQLFDKLCIMAINVSRKNAAVCGSVSDHSFVEKLIKDSRPDYIFQLAAHSSTRHEFLFENQETIATGAINILESVKKFSPGTRVFIAGSAMQFKNDGHPIDELTAFEAKSPYAVARIQSVFAARYYSHAFGLKTFVGYFFNHDSPLRDEHHVNQKIVRAVQRIASGSREKLILGNIGVQKEFNYAGDVTDAVWKLINQDLVREAVIGSGRAYAIKDWVVKCFSLKNLPWEAHVELENNFVPEYDILVSNPKVINSIGWVPQTDFHKLANMMMNA